MPAHGGYCPYPKRMGGTPNGTKPLLQIVHESLNAQRGTGYKPDDYTKVVWIENMAVARAIVFDGWGTNQRLANQRDPLRSTDMLSRWERILRIIPPPGTSDADRRSTVSERAKRFGKLANTSLLVTALQALMGDVFVAVEYIAPAVAVVHVPDGTYPLSAWGATVIGDDAPWYSTIAHILVRTRKPTGYSEGDFYKAVGSMFPLLDAILPAWVTWDWYRPGPISRVVAGGPSAGGFYLDDDHNLDNEVFDIALPHIDNRSPASGAAAGGDTVTINGYSLQHALVTFGGVPGTVTLDTEGQLQVTTPAHAAGLVVLVVSTDAGSDATVFTYV